MSPFLIGSLAAGLYLGLLAVKVFLSLRYARRYPHGESEVGEVTILQPILGGDPRLEETLRHNLIPAGPSARFVWLVDEDDAVGRDTALRLQRENAEPPCRIEVRLCPPAPEGLNPKTFKLSLALDAVETHYVAILDDDTRIAPRTLEAARHALERAEAYTGLPCYLPGENLWSSLVSHFVNNNAAFTYLPLLNFTSPITLNGMFYVMKTATLRGYGGFAAVADQVTDDYAIAKLIHKHGGTIVQGILPLHLYTTVSSGGAYLRLLHRWFVFARHQVSDQSPGVQCFLALFLVLPPFLLWIAVLSWLFGFSPTALPAFVVLVLCREGALAMGGKRSWLSWPLSLASELLQPLHLIHASLSQRIRWRSRRLRLGKDGRFDSAG